MAERPSKWVNLDPNKMLISKRNTGLRKSGSPATHFAPDFSSNTTAA